MKLKVACLIGAGEQVAALMEVSGITRDGTRFEIAGAAWGVCFTLVEGLIDEISVFPDTMFIEQALCGGVYAPNEPMRAAT